MKKYVVKVIAKEQYNDSIYFAEAKSQQDLEMQMTKEIESVYDSLDNIAHIEYTPIEKYMFEHDHPYDVCCDTLVGASWLKKKYQKEEQ